MGLLEFIGIISTVSVVVILVGWYKTRHHDPETWQRVQLPVPFSIDSFKVSCKEMIDALEELCSVTRTSALELKKLGIAFQRFNEDNENDTEIPVP